MSDFNYEIERTDHYSLVNAILYGESVQDGTPTPDNPIDIQVVEPIDGTFGISINGTLIPIDLQGNVLASLPDGTKDVLTVDSVGHVVLEKRTHVWNMRDYSNSAWSKSGSATNGFYISRTSLNPVARTNQFSNHYSSITTPVTSTSAYFSTTNSSYIDGSFNFNLDAAVVGSTVTDFKTWLSSHDVFVCAKLDTEQTIDLGTIDISQLQNIPTEIPISFVSTLTPDSSYLYENNPTYKIKNPYDDYNAPEYAYPPNHFGQEWETFDANDWNVSEMLDYTGQPESHAVYTVELCELMQSGAFNWSRPELDWSEAAYSTEQYERFCKYFEQRFMFREISMLPPLQWFTALKRMLVYELMPKYKPLYAQVENGISPLGENEYYKERHVSSSYPETLLSGNSDYISSGEDREFERIKIDNAAEALEAYRNGFRSVDAALGDELEILFISLYTSFVNAF